jgi:predicted transposase YdaD
VLAQGEKFRLEGQQGERFDIAKRLLLKKESMESVAELTGLSWEEVKALALELSIKHL